MQKDDVIYRQAAIDALNHEYRCGDIISQCGIEVAIDIISELPTIQPEPKEGHWIWVAGELMCSECHTIFTDLYPDYDISVACPHCGAKMKGSD